VKKTDKDVVRDLFTKFGRVSNQMLDEVGLLHAGHNRVSELNRTEFKTQGLKAVFTKGDTFMENAWILQPLPPTEEIHHLTQAVKSPEPEPPAHAFDPAGQGLLL
jgi:hypothetical protein